MKQLLKALHQKPIAYFPIYRQITGSTTAGIFLSQIMYWLDKKDKIFKTDADIKIETLLTDNELRAAKKIIKSLGFIKVTREGIPAKTYYEIDWDIYQDKLKEYLEIDIESGENSNTPSSLVKSTKLDETEAQDQFGEIHETNIVKTKETTTETTTKNSLSSKSPQTHNQDKLLQKKNTKSEERDFLNFVNQIRKKYKPDIDRNFYPSILKVNTQTGKVTDLKVDNNGRLYAMGVKDDIDPAQADHLWRYMFDNQEKILPLPT